MNVRKVIAWNIRRLRVERGLAQEALAVDAKVDRTYVSRLERVLENPSVLVLDRIARALDIDIIELFKKPKSGEKPPAPLRKGRKPKKIVWKTLIDDRQGLYLSIIRVQ